MNEIKSKPVPPKKKGGAVYPRIDLEEAISFARKLVSKTHVAPQPYSTVFPGVFGVAAKNTAGQVRASALKQYGLLEGKPEAYVASELARKIAVAPPEEVSSYYKDAVLRPKIFRILFDTFHGDQVSIAKVKQQAAASGVHPDESDRCANLFVDGAIFAGLGKISGETLTLAAKNSGVSVGAMEQLEDSLEENTLEVVVPESSESGAKQDDGETEKAARETQIPSPSSARSIIQVNVTLDSSLDTDKLERQLALLRKYGAI
jgi:hypothetical protein